MTIQTGPGEVRIDADDAQFTYRGTTIAIKIREVVWPTILGCVKRSDGGWDVKVDLTNDLFGSDPPGGGDVVDYWIKFYGSVEEFLKAKVLPLLNAWLNTLFAPSSQVAPLEQIQQGLKLIKFNVQTNGTVVASI